MKQLLLILLTLLALTSCGEKKSEALGAISDQCTLIDQALIGVFSNPYQEGTMTFSGGLNGTVDIAGPDYNDVLCSYLITDCSSNKMSMNCNGAPYESDLIVFSRDSVQIGTMTYTRVK